MPTKFAADCGSRCSELAAERPEGDRTKEDLIQCAVDYVRAEILAELAKIDAVLLPALPEARVVSASTESRSRGCC